MNDSLTANEVYFELKSNNVAALREFYGAKLGFQVMPEENNDFYLQVKIGANKLTGFRNVEDTPDKLALYVHVNNVNAAHAKLTAAGLDPSAISKEDWGHPATIVHDPEGRKLVFTREGDSQGQSRD